ncbi:histone deacetylase domain-containing protein [Phakopsora pachyrhizi]|nr:histone deacetylase domain-containing protein [Phakopsora pachyrhizi]KAI8454012.1 histone deacetylase domain-containing protein [Phakopsora pachyrhizi]
MATGIGSAKVTDPVSSSLENNLPHEISLNPIHFVTQDDCYKHTFCRSKDSSTIFERPERLRFVNLGFAAALAWDSIDHPGGAFELLSSDIPKEETTNNYFNPNMKKSDEPAEVMILCPAARFIKSRKRVSCDDRAALEVHYELNQPPTSASENLQATSSSNMLPSNSESVLSSSGVKVPKNYLEQLIGLCRRSAELNLLGLSEVPQHLPQGDLYLSTGSGFSILGAIGACYEAIDSILNPDSCLPSTSSTTQTQAADKQSPRPPKKAFVNIRPPGHHCTNSDPMGFCWVNNVLISCLYSNMMHDIDRICIVDIDLHHGNGSQEIVWQINEKSEEIVAAYDGKAKVSELMDPSSQSIKLNPLGKPETTEKRNLKISYSSLHDINSYPCEDGDPERIKDASLNICVGNSINQFIQNLHLESWANEAEFYEHLYPEIWSKFESHMTKFFEITNARPESSLIFVSAGFDACEYESDSMSRYSKKLPVSFYNKFAGDIGHFSELHCQGKVVSILEGGYSDQTLVGSSLSYILGMLGNFPSHIEPSQAPWTLLRINRLLSLCKKPSQMRSNRSASSNKMNQNLIDDEKYTDLEWTSETKRIFEHIDSYEYLRSEWSKQIKQEEKLLKAQISMRQLLLVDSTPSDGTLRRSQRHASNTSPATRKMDPNAHSPSNRVVKSEKNHLECFILAESSNQKPTNNHPAGSEMLQSIDSLFEKLNLDVKTRTR